MSFTYARPLKSAINDSFADEPLDAVNKSAATNIVAFSKKHKATWAQAYANQVSNYLLLNGKIITNLHIDNGVIFTETNLILTKHLKNCGIRKCKNITEETFSIYGWDSTIEEVPNRIPTILLTGKVYCKCGKIKNQVLTVESLMADILYSILTDNDTVK